MQIAPTLVLLVLPFLAEPARAQRVEAVNSLGRARSTYDASDTDRNGRVSIEEFARQRLVIPRADFDVMDFDKDGTWSKEEFLVYYRRLLLNSGQRPAEDLEAEVARIQALRRTRVAPSTPKPPVEAPKTAVAPGANDAADAAIVERLRLAIDDLERKAALRQAKREDFQRVKDSLVARARAAAGSAAEATEWVAKFEAAVIALETQAREDRYSREEYGALRELLISRGRTAAQSPPVPAPNPSLAPSAPANAALTPDELHARLDAALDDLARKAEARGATRDDYTRVKEAFVARARAAVPAGDPARDGERATLEQRFFAALDELENEAREGRFTRERFTAVREAYIARVRAIAAPAPAPADTPPAPGSVGDLAARLDSALDELARKAEARQATRDDFGRVREALIARTRALAASDPAAAGRQGRLDELFLSAMDKLETEALAGRYSREEFQNLRESYIGRARAIVERGAPGAAPVVPEAGAGPPPVPAPAANDDIVKRFEDALSDLERKALARGATRADYQRVNDLLAARARAAVAAQPDVPVGESDARVTALVGAFQGAMTRLEGAAANGGIGAADFANLRALFVARARDAVTPPKPAPETPKPEPQKPPEGPRERARPGPEAPKPAEPPKEGRPGRPVPPQRG